MEKKNEPINHLVIEIHFTSTLNFISVPIITVRNTGPRNPQFLVWTKRDHASIGIQY